MVSDTHYEWLAGDGVLHFVPGFTSADWDEWVNDEFQGRRWHPTICQSARRLTLPGVASRIAAPRCRRCCAKLGIPEGYGTPRNEAASLTPAKR